MTEPRQLRKTCKLITDWWCVNEPHFSCSMWLQRCVSPDGHQRGLHSNYSPQRSTAAAYFCSWHDEFNCRRCHTFIYINRLNQSYSCALQIRELLPRFSALDGSHLCVTLSVFNTHTHTEIISGPAWKVCLNVWLCDELLLSFGFFSHSLFSASSWVNHTSVQTTAAFLSVSTQADTEPGSPNASLTTIYGPVPFRNPGHFHHHLCLG